MPDSLVLDASIAVKWYLPAGAEPHLDEARALLDRFARGTLALHAPDLLAVEVGNVLARRAPNASKHFDEFLALPITRHPADDALLRKAHAIQLERKTIMFDALYLALAESLRIPLVTEDAGLIRDGRGTAVSLESIQLD